MGLFLGSLCCSLSLFVSVPIPYCSDYCNFVILFEIREHDTSSFVVLSQDCFIYLEAFVVSYKFEDCLFHFCEKWNQNCDRTCIESVDFFGK